ncbi:thiamine pyrophosphokinase [Puccinia triticina 1-1 BBBD Race 1]|uniref:Thiamine pyrophosphokinase n=1 Tax=Puccinia triticina (isolate 1-1 / race 1 (BBBD)) TaxID=630390 RepID=A0A180H0A2_PUCT1|nr:thiamine pyrophosphokinase [Puccinia triticina 1-1 BBBD Race 1]
MAERQWNGPFDRSTSIGRKSKTYLIILNTPIKISHQVCPNRVFEDLWELSDCRICADGGANRLYDYCSDLVKAEETPGANRRMLIPDYIKGDLDSIRPQVKHFFENSDCHITRDQDQDSTDFGKCLALIEELESRPDSNDSNDHPTGLLLIHGGLTGRLDQTIHTLHTLLLRLGSPPTSPGDLPQGLPETWVVDTDAGSMACALERGVKHLLPIPPSWRQGASPLTCGILPIGIKQATVTTRGLKWNLNQAKTSITGLLSTSNHILTKTEVVQVESDDRVVWTIEIPESAMR